MIRLNVHEAKTHLSRYLEKLEQGETILLCRRNVPIAEIRPLAKAPKPRVLGIDEGVYEIPENFYEPMSEEELALWEGPIEP